MWTSDNEHCEKMMLEEKENNIEEVRKERDNWKEYSKKLQKEIEELKKELLKKDTHISNLESAFLHSKRVEGTIEDERKQELQTLRTYANL